MSKTSILYDAQIFDILAFGGIPRYYTEVMKGVKQNNNFSISIGAKYIRNQEVEQLFPLPIANKLLNRLITLCILYVLTFSCYTDFLALKLSTYAKVDSYGCGNVSIIHSYTANTTP